MVTVGYLGEERHGRVSEVGRCWETCESLPSSDRLSSVCVSFFRERKVPQLPSATAEVAHMSSWGSRGSWGLRTYGRQGMTVSIKVDKSLSMCRKMKTQEQQRGSSSPNLKPQESGEPAVNILDQKLVGLRYTKNGELSQQEADEQGAAAGGGSLLVVVMSLFS